jgi:hypothetical protein
MTLLERVEAAVQTASRAEALAQRATAAQGIDEIAAQLRALRLRLVEATARRAALKSHATGVADWPDPAKALVALNSFHQVFESEPTGGKTELRKLVPGLTKVVDTAEQSVSDAVSRCRKSLREDARPLEDLGSVEGFVDQVAAAKQGVEALLSQEWGHADGETLAKLLKKRSELQKRFDSLVRSDVPKAVRTFFRAARSGGATLDLLTDEVISWLKENGQRDKVRLVIK